MCHQKPFSSRSPSVLDYCDPSVTEAFAQFSNSLPTKCAKHQYYPLFFQNYHVDNFIFHSIPHKFNVLSLRSSKREPFVFMLLSLYPLPLKALVSVLEYPLVLRKKGKKKKPSNRKPSQPTLTKTKLLSLVDNNLSRAAACPAAPLTCAPNSEGLEMCVLLNCHLFP